MVKVGEAIRCKQPEVYRQLMLTYTSEDKKQDIETSFRETEKLMRHDAYDRRRGGIRQIRRG
ncbi:hypothetical protein DEAC_c14070 [Desulfosporosinus acididurans]|uniref:Uncharacterized protein n=1 Tax=Desulfosporosinus acididurans TaxID=476652 RepID=A0A0J1FTD7_9FIRM|nr:hypothetical protein [Desulfosporosinus acididurans]KLU66739.1 hypothetical protein DEAC_c14070 [Desulfosporosinus acididurans]